MKKIRNHQKTKVKEKNGVINGDNISEKKNVLEKLNEEKIDEKITKLNLEKEKLDDKLKVIKNENDINNKEKI